MREPEKIHPLKIGLIGYNREQTLHELLMLYKENFEQIIRVEEHRVEFKDGTEIRAIYNENDTRGIRFDQVILCDDERWNIWEERKNIIDNVLWDIAGYSCVPEEYIIMKCEY